jgi:hypothetical protein
MHEHAPEEPRWDDVLAFLPELEAPGFDAGDMVWEEGQFPYFNLTPVGTRLYRTLYDSGVPLEFNWSKWGRRADELMHDPRALGRARLVTLRKLLYGHVRYDRFCEGHFGLVLESGHIAAVLRRAAHLLGKPISPRGVA